MIILPQKLYVVRAARNLMRSNYISFPGNDLQVYAHKTCSFACADRDEAQTDSSHDLVIC